jgi:anti-sigma B factor antagonist/stage II sporulation protein AA (anti-sigma F factor antagonist)
MDLHPKMSAGVKVVAPAGRIDHASADEFQTALEPHLAECRESEPALVVDMSKVEYISSVGLRVLMVAAKQVKSQNGCIVVAGLTPLVKEVFEISRFNLVFDVFDSVEAAARTHGERQ